MSKISEQTLQHYTILGTERILCYQPNALEDGYITPTDIAQAPVSIDTVSGVTYTFVNADKFRMKKFTSNNAITASLSAGTVLGAGNVYQCVPLGTGRITFPTNGTSGLVLRYPKAADGTTDCRISRAVNSPVSFVVLDDFSILFEGDLASS